MAQLPDPWRSLSGELARIKARLDDVTRRSPFFGSGMQLDGVGGVQSDDFDGDLATGDAGTKGWAMNAVRAAFGELILRPGSIGNDSLTSPLVPGVARASANNFALSTPSVLAELAGTDVPVPPGCTRLLATVSGSVFSYNQQTTGGSNGAGGDAIYCSLQLGGQSSATTVQGVSGSGGYATAFGAEAFEFAGLTPGSTLRLSVYGASAYQALAANSGNRASVSAALSFLR